MWNLENLKTSYKDMRSVVWDQYTLEEVEAFVKYHAAQVVLNIDALTPKQKVNGIKAVNEITEYYDKRLKVQNPKPKSLDDAPTPTETYKQKFGMNPTEAYRQLFGDFDKNKYSKWLLQVIK